MADESETMMSATLRFPFQASLDGYTMVETDGILYYGLDISQEPAELPAQAYPHSNSESDTQLGLGLESDDDYKVEDKQQEQHSSSKIMFHLPRWDSLVKDPKQEEKPEDVAPRPISVIMHPHRINTSDQQRFATEREMAAAEEAEEENIMYESPPSSTLDETEAEEELTIRASAPSSSVQQFIPSRYYATPLIEDDLTSTPVTIYGLEKPSGHVPKKKAPAVLRQRGNSAAAQARPSSRHQRQPSPLSSAVNPQNRVEEQARASTSSTRRLSMFLGRTPTPTVPSAGVSRPTIGSISSAGSSATISTLGSAVSAISDVSAATSMSTSSSPTMVDANRKPVDLPSHPTTIPDSNQPTSSSFTRPAQPLRRTTAPISSFPTEYTPMIGGDIRRNSIFNFSMPKLSSPMMYHRAGIQSSENLTTIRAVSDDQVAIPAAANARSFHDSSLEEASSSSKQMPFSPDSFVSPHTHAHTSENIVYNNTTSFSQINRPHTSHHDQRPPPISNTSTPQYQAYTRTEQQQPQLRKQKKSDHHQHRATKLFTRIFV